LKHESKVITDLENRRITLSCTCGWIRQLGLEDTISSRYADADAWASHFDSPSTAR
jgi:hypothetical protein